MPMTSNTYFICRKDTPQRVGQWKPFLPRERLHPRSPCHTAAALLEMVVMKINYPKAKTLCTDAEFRILTATKPRELATLAPAALRKLSTQARKYSDKWLQQSRKHGNSSTGAAQRSFEKHEYFKEALERIEAKLAKTATPAAAKKAPVKKAAAKKASAKKAAAKKAPAKKVPAKKTPAKKAAKKAASKKAKKAVAKKAAKKAASSRARSAMSLATQAKQRSIGTGLRMAASGKNSRVRGHVSAQGRRNQAARSARKR